MALQVAQKRTMRYQQLINPTLVMPGLEGKEKGTNRFGWTYDRYVTILSLWRPCTQSPKKGQIDANEARIKHFNHGSQPKKKEKGTGLEWRNGADCYKNK